MTPIMYKYAGMLLILVTLLASAYYKGYSGEHEKLIAFQAKVAQEAADQKAQSELKDKQAKENENASKQAAADAMQGISDYYRAHPVVRMRNPSSCSVSVPQTIGSTQVTDDSATSGYFSPYSPEVTEEIAGRLYELQKLLTADGVEIE